MIFVLCEKNKTKKLEAVGLLEADGDQKLFFVSLLLLIVVVVELFIVCLLLFYYGLITEPAWES